MSGGPDHSATRASVSVDLPLLLGDLAVDPLDFLQRDVGG